MTKFFLIKKRLLAKGMIISNIYIYIYIFEYNLNDKKKLKSCLYTLKNCFSLKL